MSLHGKHPQIEREREDVKDVVDTRPAGNGHEYLLEMDGVATPVPQSEHLRENERASDGCPNNRQQSCCVDRKAAQTARSAVQAKRYRRRNREEQRRSFAYGNTAYENPRITREMIDRQAEKLAEAAGDKRRA